MPIKPGNSHGLLNTSPAHGPVKITPLPNLPDVENILSLSLPTIRHIPRRSNRNQWVKALCATFDHILTHPDAETGYKLLFMLPVCCLRMPPRTGTKVKSKTKSWFAALLDRWLAGDYENLWTDAERQFYNSTPRVAKATDIFHKRNAQRALLLVREQNLRKAVQCLLSDGLADCTDAAIDALISKHPDSRLIKLPRLVPASFLAKFHLRFCSTCFRVVALNPRTHQCLDISDSMPN